MGMPFGRVFVLTAVTVGLASACSQVGGAAVPQPSRGDVAGRPTSSTAVPVTSRDLLSGLRAGDTIPAGNLRDALLLAIQEAGSWRTDFEDTSPVQIVQVLDQGGGPAVRVRGLDDDPMFEARLVGDEEYELRRYPGPAYWECRSRRDQNPSTRVPATMVDGTMELGSPQVLVRAIEPEGAARVQSVSGRDVSLEVVADRSGFSAMVGAGPAGGHDQPVRSTWVFHDGLPVRARVTDSRPPEDDLRFSEWGTAGPVQRPPAGLVKAAPSSQIPGRC
jgi:hypothetical protein